MENALRKAHEAGNVEDAKRLANALKSMGPTNIQGESMPDQKQQDSGFGASLQSNIEAIPRNIGLTGRAAIEGSADFLSIFTNPLTAGLEALTGKDVARTSEMGRKAADLLSLPTPETPIERIAQQGAKIMVPVGGQAAGAAQLAGKVPGVVGGVISALSKAPGSQLAGAAGGGTAGQAVAETGGGAEAQFAASLAGGFGGAALPSVAVKITSGINGLVQSIKGTQSNIAQISERLNQILEPNGLKVGDIPPAIRNQLLREMKKASDIGGDVDPAVLRRIADYASVGATPTKGSVTLDPVAITQERNLAKYGANSSDEALQALAQRQRSNDMTLTRNLNEMGAQRATDTLTAGERMKVGLQRVDAPRKTAVDAAYQAVRDNRGRYADLDVPAFSNTANAALDEQMLGSALPSGAKALLNDVSSGKIPLNVNTMAQLDKRFSGMRSDLLATGNKEGALAVQTLRQALWNTPPSTAAGERAIQQYQKARMLAAQRFKAIEENPAMAAALDDADPDRFVQQYIVGSGKDASFNKTRSLVTDLRKMPEVFQVAKEQILWHLKSKALSGGADETANFSPSAYNKALNAIGEQKLRLFFNTSEVNKLKAVGRVASYEKFQPTGSAVNNSNTASAALTSIIEKVGGNAIVAKIPVIRVLGSFAADQSRAQLAKQAARNSLSPGFTTAPQLERPPAAALALPAITGISEQP